MADVHYRLNPSKNAGVVFQFDDVVRNKHERRRLDGDDCECCHDVRPLFSVSFRYSHVKRVQYYEAVGPLPTLPRRPAWRSHPTTPVKNHRITESKSPTLLKTPNEQVVTLHKKQISRHRQQWKAPKTPPGYWDIGFPDTQEVADINERAEELHKQKRRHVASEAKCVRSGFADKHSDILSGEANAAGDTKGARLKE